MLKYCSKCGAQMDEVARFCPACGSQVSGFTQDYQTHMSKIPGLIPNRNILTCLLLSIFTCNIYMFIWFTNVVDDANKIYPDDMPSGGMVILYSFLTCGIYGLYWAYRMGKKLHEAGKRYGVKIEDQAVLYMILQMFGLSYINLILMQTDLNQLS